MAKYWCSPSGEKIFPASDYSNCPGLSLIDFPDEAPAAQPQAPVAVPIVAEGEASNEQLFALYEQKFGRKPHHSMKLENVRKAVME